MSKLLLAMILVVALLVSGCRSPLTTPTGENRTASKSNTTVSTPSAGENSTIPTQRSLPVPTTPLPSAPLGNQLGNLAPDFQLQTLSGETVSLSELRGKPVLINFWATWCGPCRFEMPFLQQIHNNWSNKGLVLLAIDFKENSATIQKFMDELSLSLTVPMDTDGQVTKAYGITAIPTSFLIDKNGIIQQKVIGAFSSVEAIENELIKIIP